MPAHIHRLGSGRAYKCASTRRHEINQNNSRYSTHHDELGNLDDGVGLPMQVESSAGMGLKLLRYRANLLRARIRIQPGSTRGTLLIFTIEQPP
jgi:nitrate/nitrite-specific signal transduction histidine kinase